MPGIPMRQLVGLSGNEKTTLDVELPLSSDVQQMDMQPKMCMTHFLASW